MENETAIAEDRKAAHRATLNLHVRYISARQPFIDSKADPDETLAGLKPRVLAFFGLTEGSADGGTKTYTFAHDGEVLADPNATLAALAGDKHVLKLDLLERFEQG